MRALFEALGATVAWEAESRTAIATRGNIEVRIPVNSTAARVNGLSRTLDVPARIIAGRTFIPLRFVSEALGDAVSWDGVARVVSIQRRDAAATPPPAAPDPRISLAGYTEGYSYGVGGLITAVEVGVEVTNGGAAGDVRVSVSCPDTKYAAASVFPMAPAERVLVQASFPVLTRSFQCQFRWQARAAAAGDTSAGTVKLIRATLKPLGRLAAGRVQAISVAGGVAYLVTDTPEQSRERPFGARVRLAAVDVTAPAAPRPVGSYEFGPADVPFSRYGIGRAGNALFVAIGHHDEHAQNGLHLFNIAEPARPRPLARLTFGKARPRALAVRGDQVYVATQESSLTRAALEVIDVRDPAQPRTLGRYAFDGMVDSVAVLGEYAFAAGGGRLRSFDIRSPAAPRELAATAYATTTGSGREAVAVRPGYAYVATPRPQLLVYDIADPAKPALQGQYTPAEDLYAGYDLAVEGDGAYLAYTGGLLALDVRDPRTPARAGLLTGSGISGRSVAATGGYVYLGGGQDVVILPQPVPAGR